MKIVRTDRLLESKGEELVLLREALSEELLLEEDMGLQKGPEDFFIQKIFY